MNAPFLALHTTEPTGSAAVWDGARVTWREFSSAGHHAPVVAGEIQAVLAAAGVALGDCRGVAVTSGPGSFTGIRIGLATAQGLAAARGYDVWVCDSLLARAARACGAAASVLESGTGAPATSVLESAADGPATPLLAVALDARRGEIFAALYDVSHQVPIARVAPFCAGVAAAVERLRAAVPDAERLAIDGSAAEWIRALPAFAAARTVPEGREPVAAALARLTIAGACRLTRARDLEPNYLRKSDAELARDNALEGRR